MQILAIAITAFVTIAITLPVAILLARWAIRKEIQHSENSDNSPANRVVVSQEPEFPENWC